MEQSAHPIFDYFAEKNHRLDAAKADSWTLDLYQQGILDSVGILELVQFLEQKYDVVFSADDLEPENFRTIRKMVELLNQRGLNLNGATT
jgi:acyl carrier protein